LQWDLLKQEGHAGVRLLSGDLNNLYRGEPSLHTCEHSPDSFEWIDVHDAEKNVLSFLRKGPTPDARVAVVCNFSPVPRANYRVGVSTKGFWKEVLNTDAKQYGGSGRGNFGGVETVPIPLHGRNYSLTVDLPPLAAVFFSLDVSAS
jgi:1,4-alpha-glucan branching enzyme